MNGLVYQMANNEGPFFECVEQDHHISPFKVLKFRIYYIRERENVIQPTPQGWNKK